MMTGWQLGSLNLRTVGYNIRSTSGWDGFPGIKDPVSEAGYRHGYFLPSGGRWVYHDRDVILTMGILPVDRTTGGVLSSPDEHIEENIEYVAQAMYSNDGGVIQLQKTLPSGLIKTIGVIPRDAQTFSADGQFRSITLVFNAPYPFWHGGPLDENSGLSGGFSLDNLGTAPINDMVITFNAAVTLTHTASGAEIVTTAGGIVLDVGAGSEGLISGDQSDISCNKPWILEMVKGSNAFTVSGGTVDIDYYHGYLT